MAPRTDAASVGAIIEVDDSISLTPFIAVANNLVNRVCVSDDSEYDEETLTLIETWLAAHFYAIRDMRPSNEGAGPVSTGYQYKVDLNLANTMYGQQAMLIDTEGGLAAYNKAIMEGGRTRVGITWLGQERQQNAED